MKSYLVMLMCYVLLIEIQGAVNYNWRNKILPSNSRQILVSDLEKINIKPHSSKATIIKQEYKRFNDGGYRFYFETSEGQSREEVGFFRDDPKLGRIFTVHGSYGYIGPSNKKVFVKYTSDERGFRYENSPYPPVGLPSNIINQQIGLFNI